MSRIVVKTAHAPKVIDGKEGPISICMCGLSKNQPYCDGSHNKTLDEAEGKTYSYHENDKREEVEIEADGGCCGKCDTGKCCGHCDHQSS